MASATSSSALARGRSVRVPATARQAQPPTSHTTRTLVIPTSGPLAPGSSGSGASGGSFPSPTTTGNSAQLSNLELFLANLRLLDLDLLPDWPGISTQTFAGGASQGQKRRVQAVEWALYHLFALWDPQETRSKLDQFFPPADQVQSLSLRAALLKLLDQAKKAGSLGRDTVIRKTMLDDCRGERLEEVLASFSFAVLRKAASDGLDSSGAHPAAAQRLALENRGYAGERTELLVLKMAYSASLCRGMVEKNDARKLFVDFAELLGVKERGLARRRERVKGLEAQKCASEVKEAETKEVHRLVRNNWAGNERWMETLLNGDADAGDGLLGLPFERVWRRVRVGRLGELEDTETGLVEQLDGRVRFQRERLRKWQDLRKDMFGEGASRAVSEKQAPPEQKTGLGIQFDAHKNLRLERTSPRKKDVSIATQAALTAEYAGLVSSLEAELRATAQVKKPSLAALIPKLTPVPVERYSVASEPVATSEPEDREEDLPVEPVPGVTKLPQRRTMVRPRPIRKTTEEELPRVESVGDKDTLGHRPKLGRKATEEKLHGHDAAPERSKPLPRKLRDPRASKDPPLATRPSRQTRASTPPQTREPEPHPLPSHSPTRGSIGEQRVEVTHPEPEPTPPEEPESPTQQEADAILASMNAASPSPVKQPFKPRPTLTLAERTLLSMRPSGSTPDEDEDITLPIHRSKFKPISHLKGSSNNDDNEDDEDDLVARTRKSMAGFEAARQKAQLERQRSQRKSRHVPPSSPQKRAGGSYFPGVSEEGEDTSMLAEELMGGEQNYEDVFMSRPRIKASPVGSPTKEWDEEE